MMPGKEEQNEFSKKGATRTRLQEPETKEPAAEWMRSVFVEIVFYLRVVLCALVVRNTLLSLSLVALVMGSAVAVIYSSHMSRQLFSELKGLQAERDQFEREWTQLLLEQSAWSAHSRIEKVASSELKMRVPQMHEVVVVNTE